MSPVLLMMRQIRNVDFWEIYAAGNTHSISTVLIPTALPWATTKYGLRLHTSFNYKTFRVEILSLDKNRTIHYGPCFPRRNCNDFCCIDLSQSSA